MNHEEIIRNMALALWFISDISNDTEFEEDLVTASVALSTAIEKAQPGVGWTSLVPDAIKRVK